MSEIRINSKSCPNCGHRNVTEENQLCERCGTSLYKGHTLKWIISALAGVLLLIATSIFLVNGMGDKQNSYQPRHIKKAENPAVKKQELPVTPSIPPATNAVDKKIEEQPVETPDTEWGDEQEEDQKEEPKEKAIEKEGNVFFAKHEKTPPASSSKDYLALTRGSELLAKDLQIRVESKLIENVENDQLEWLASEMQKSSNEGKQLTLLSFAEAYGSSQIAEQRALFAQRVLNQKYNITNSILIKSFGPSEGNNDMRIEAWLK